MERPHDLVSRLDAARRQDDELHPAIARDRATFGQAKAFETIDDKLYSVS
jgi:hypothetical protein